MRLRRECLGKLEPMNVSLHGRVVKNAELDCLCLMWRKEQDEISYPLNSRNHIVRFHP